MRVLHLILKDLLQIIRDWKTALFLVVMPIVFTLFFGFVSGGTGTLEDDPRLPVGFVNSDQTGTLGTTLHSLLGGSEAIRPEILKAEDAEQAGELVRDESLVAVVIVPADFSERAIGGDEPKLTIIVDETTQAGHMVTNAVHAILTRLWGTVWTAQISVEALEAQERFEDESARQAYLNEALALAADAWENPSVAITVEQPGSKGESEEPTNPFTQSSPGMIVQFVVLGLISSAMVLVLERRSTALRRLLTTPISRVELIGGHMLAMFLVSLVQQALLIAVGQLAFGVEYMREPLGTFLVMVTLALWSSSLGLFIGAIAKTEEQVIMWSLIAMFVFSGLGGSWFPLEFTGPAFSTIGHLMPTAWAMDGFQNIVLRGLGLSSVLLPAGLLFAYGVVFFALAVWRFKYE